MPRVSKKKTAKKKTPAKKAAVKKPVGKNFDKELNAIYKANGKMPNLTKLDKKRTSWLTRFLIRFIIIAVFLSAIAWAGFLLFDPWGTKNEQTLTVEITGPEQIVSGEEVEFIVSYKNTGSTPLAALELQLNLPDAFRLTSTRPGPTTGDDTWTIGSLRPGSDGSIDLQGIVISNVPASFNIQAVITYRPANFNSDFQDIESMEFTVQETVLEGKVTAPEKGAPGDTLEYVYEIQNTGDVSLSDLYVVAQNPNSFLIEETTPEFYQLEEAIWKIDLINPNETIELKLKGNYAAEAQDIQELTYVSYFMSEAEIPLEQTVTKAQTNVLGSKLVSQLIVNGSPKNQAVNLGDNLRISLNYTNNGEEDLGEVSYLLSVSGNQEDLPVDWENADLSDGELDQTNNTISWSYEQLPELLLLPPEYEGVIDITLPLVEAYEENLADELELNLTSTIQSIGELSSERTLSSSPISLAVNSDFAFAATARYFDQDGVALGTGPLPPEVDETTTYRIEWVVNNSLHRLNELALTTSLPLDSSWAGRTDSDIGQLSFDPESRTVTWYIDSLPTSINEVSCYFEVSVTPDDADVGSFIRLTNQSSASAEDASTDKKLTRSLAELTTELPEDEHATGNGVVVEND